jgi:hypothetical protein
MVRYRLRSVLLDLAIGFCVMMLLAASAGAGASAAMLRRGDRGESVYELQEQLALAGYLDSEADGIFGNQTHAAVVRLQKMPGYQWMALLAQKHGALLLRRFSPNHTVRMWWLKAIQCMALPRDSE